MGDLAVIALVRYAVECLDGVCLLLARGSILPCYPLLRSLFEAWLGVRYVLQGDSNERAAAYFVTQINQERLFFERYDPTTNRGRELTRELQNDIAGSTAIDKLALQEIRDHLAALQADLDDPMLRTAAQAWKDKEKTDPEWYSLFDKAESLRGLARNLCYLSGYELHYRPWCRQVHATATLKSLSSNDDEIELRPIRHPDGIHEVVYSAGLLAITLAGQLIQKYDPLSDETTLARYKDLSKEPGRSQVSKRLNGKDIAKFDNETHRTAFEIRTSQERERVHHPSACAHDDAAEPDFQGHVAQAASRSGVRRIAGTRRKSHSRGDGRDGGCSVGSSLPGTKTG